MPRVWDGYQKDLIFRLTHYPDFGDYAVFGLVLLLIIMFFRGRRNTAKSMGSPLVLKTFTVNEAAPDGIAVHIVGRKSGLIAWLLTVVGFDALTTLIVNETEISFKSSSLYGQMLKLVPISMISSTTCGYFKPFGFLLFGTVFAVVGVIFAIGGIVAGALILIALGGILLGLYWTSKSMIISLTAGGMEPVGLRLRPSVIHGMSINLDKVAAAVTLINRRVAGERERGLR